MFNLTNPRSEVVDIFRELYFRSVLDAFFARVSGKNTRLASFSDQAPHPPSRRKYLGLQDIPLEKITGSVGRELDFDNRFRPLSKHLRERWVNVYLGFTQNELPPIRVYKLRENYFVEDGHHRLSVARTMEKAYIRAEVWDYALPESRTVVPECKAAKCNVRVKESSPA